MATVYYSNLQYTVDISRPKWVNDHRMMGLIPLRAASKITCHSGHQWTWSFNDSNSLQGRRAGMSSCSNWSFPICECEMPVLGSHHGLCLHSLCHIYIYIHISMYIYIYPYISIDFDQICTLQRQVPWAVRICSFALRLLLGNCPIEGIWNCKVWTPLTCLDRHTSAKDNLEIN